MVIATITSGLGNQLFQYALARQLSLVRHSNLFFDLRFYKSEYSRETNRSFKLDRFNISFDEISKVTELGIKFTKLFPNQSFDSVFQTVKEQYYHFDPSVLDAKGLLLNLKGYWHSEKYFKSAEKEIRYELKFNNQKGVNFEKYKHEVDNSECPVSVHIRRGDYVNHPEFSKSFGFIGLEYYEKAMQLIEARFPGCRFFIFTDDKPWVLEHFGDKETLTFVDNIGPDADLDDLHLMKLCRHNIIANSSFSWWGAWLNDSLDKLVVAPERWFKNQPTWDTKDLLPDSWLKI